ncbi:MAG TPA: SDR family oxidoreductase [Nocardioides sp.]|nr:SDR family oxidoreductase [Nocardioides sp.]
MLINAERRAVFDFTGSVVLVTGGGTGIGLSVARAFLSSGATVAVSGRRAEPLEEAVADIEPERTLALPCDVGDRDAVNYLVESVVKRFGRLDIVVSNAAIFVSSQLTDLDQDTWEQMRRANVDGFYYLAQATLPLLERSGGSLVAVSSVSGERGDWSQAGYNATKAAVSNFVRSLALDYGPRGVRINAVAPAFTVTDMTRAVADDPAARKVFENRVALGQLAGPDDIAGSVLFLASDAAAYVTGVVLPVDGGTSASTGQGHVA